MSEQLAISFLIYILVGIFFVLLWNNHIRDNKFFLIRFCLRFCLITLWPFFFIKAIRMTMEDRRKHKELGILLKRRKDE